ncbi:MAG: phosphoserine phosphatase SerB [Burkholderiales bacterium]|nr:phosphoserine phosphatase SerB [Burkholderiales bacterium]
MADFVVQAPIVTPAVIARLARQAGAQAIVPVGSGAPAAWRFPEVAQNDALVDAARAAGCDAAFVPEDRRLADVGVVVLDMDSTLITIECIDEIADMKGLKPQVAAITASAMRGEIDFAQSLTQRVALLAGLPVEALERVYAERLRISVGAARMLAGFKAAGATTALVSGGFTYFTDRLKAALPLDVAVANTLGVDGGRLTGRIEGPIVDGRAKADTLRALRNGPGGGLAVAIGDGANDLPMFTAADVAIAYRAKPVVRAQAACSLDVCGLDGALNFFA